MSTRNAILTRPFGAERISQDHELTNLLIEEGAASESGVGAVKQAIQLNEEVALSMRFPAGSEKSFEEAYTKASNYINFLRQHIPDVPPMLDEDFYRRKTKQDFRSASNGDFASFMTRLSPLSEKKDLDGFAL